ncbi:glycosyl hydrolase family 61-domain-containing protein [Xylaria flabelliformis]|nr:glycosyl hydrolase family 61-domain-containing protein [Xylaria flabelliformis]
MVSALWALAATATAIIPVAHSHFTFVRVSVNGIWEEPGRYFRNKTSPFVEPATESEGYIGYFHSPTFPQHLPNSLRCGRDSFAHAAETEVLTVKAGDTLEFAHTRIEPKDWKDYQWYGCPEGRGSCDPNGTQWEVPYMEFAHPGPVLAHLSQVPDELDVHDYDGSGEWVKIYTLGYEFYHDNPDRIIFLAHNYTGRPGRIIFDIPGQTPAGEYLLRVDLIWAYYKDSQRVAGGYTQLYPSCLQVKVESAVEGSLPAGGIKIPENLCRDCPGMLVGGGMYGGQGEPDDDYVYPGGLQWDGEKMFEVKPPVRPSRS